jgi:hypothetical protein
VEAGQRKARRGYDSKYVVHDGRRFVYFVLQKVACSSVKTALLPLFDLDTERFERVRRDGSRVVQIHKLFDASPCQINREEFVAGSYGHHFKFAFVRNPWDRLVSCYSQKIAVVRKDPSQGTNLNPREIPKGEKRFYHGMPFAEFVEAVHATPDEEANPHFRSQHVVVCDPEGRVLADFVGRFERLREDFALVSERIGAPHLELPHRLKSAHRASRPYTDFYDGRLRRLVAERYEGDIETFGYAF